MVLSYYFSIAVLAIDGSRAPGMSFEALVHKDRHLQRVAHHVGNKVHSFNASSCHIYPVHVSRWPTVRPPLGVACYCDWVVATNGFYGKTLAPKIVFIATRALYMFDDIINYINHPIVLVSAINDETIPINLDQRIALPKGFTGDENSGLWHRIVNHQNVLHWFAENHSVKHPKVSTLPIGFVVKPNMPEPDVVYKELLAANKIPWAERTTLMLDSDRVRTGTGQWRDRGLLRTACLHNPLCSVSFNYTTAKEEEAHEQDMGMFNDHVGNSKFLIMAHGGGIDPCPKLFHSILLGAIPIIEDSPLRDAYEQLPVVIVPNLLDFLDPTKTQLAQEQLDGWAAQYVPYFIQGSALRNETLYKLTTPYWWEKITSHLKV